MEKHITTPLTDEKVRELQKLLAGLLCEIPISKAALPHTVFAEEEDEHGNPAFIRYRLTSINPTNGTCLLKDETGKETNRPLTDINTDWLAILLDRCYELMPRKKTESPKLSTDKELWAFLYPCKRFQRDTPDWRIIAGYEIYNDKVPAVKKLTPDELAERLNSEMFNDQEFYVRFIELPKP